MKFEIKHWWRPEIVASVEIDAKFEPSNYYVQLGAAVQVAVNERRSLDGARLDGARLDGARLDGASLVCARLDGASLRGIKITHVIARLTRTIESYEFIAVRAQDGRCMILAGCRGPWTIAQYREHVKASYRKTEKGDETLAILDFIELRDKADAKAAKEANAA